MATTLTPTREQCDIVDASRTGVNLVIEAVAGAGKTSTLKMVAAATSRPALYVAYNRAIATEAAASFPSHVTCKTAHALAFASIGVRYRHRLNGPRQPARIAAERLGITSWLDLEHDRVSPKHLARIAIATVARYCHSADTHITADHVPFQHGILGDDHDALTRAVLPYATRAWGDITNPRGRLRFEHDHYLKIWALTRPRLDADIVMLDECQDSNPVVAQVVQAQTNAQLIAVGDSSQQLYAWRGAVDALANWPAEHHLYLSQSWRFGPAIAAEANKWLTIINAPVPVIGNPAIRSTIGPTCRPDAILCRTNAETIKQLMTQLAANRRVALVGGAAAIKSLAQAADELKAGRGTSHPELYIFRTWAELQDYVDDEPAGADLKPFVDLIDSIGTDAVITAIDHLVDESHAQTILSTAHKSKGREFPVVQIATDFPEPKTDDGGAPAPIARTDAMLAYVSVTRARQHLDREGLAWIDQHIQ